MRTLAAVLCLIAVFVVSRPACAQSVSEPVVGFITGKQLTEMCQSYLQSMNSGQPMSEGHGCAGYVVGVIDTLQSKEGNEIRSFAKYPICLPIGVNASNIIEIVAKFVVENSQLRQYSGVGLVIMATASAFPCK